MPRKAEKKPEGYLPPHSAEAEESVISCCLLNPQYALNECEEKGLELAWFYDLRYALVYVAMRTLHTAGAAVDVVTVQSQLGGRNELESVGGVAELIRLGDVAPSAFNVGAYLAILREKYLLRRVLQVCTTACLSVQEEGEKNADEILSKVELDVLRLSEATTARAEKKLVEVVPEVVADMEDYHRGKPQLRGMTTGLEYLDKMLCGIGGRQGNYIVLSGRPGTGKTALAMQIAMHAALDYEWFEPELNEQGKPIMIRNKEDKEVYKTIRRVGVPVGIFSLEMTTKALVQRMLFQSSGEDMQTWRNGYRQKAAEAAIFAAANKMCKPDNVYIDDTSRCTIETLRAKVRRMARQYGVKLFVIDYIQLMRAGRRFRDDRVQELAEISGELQALGKELDVPIIVLAQMNRDFEKEISRQPRLADLKDCGSIEQDADLVGFLYNPRLKQEKLDEFQEAVKEVYKEKLEKLGVKTWALPQRVNLVIAKNRNGMSGDVDLVFEKSCTRFADYVRWLKDHDFKEPALGERRADGAQDEGDLDL